MTGEDVVRAFEDDARAVAAQNDDEAAVAQAFGEEVLEDEGLATVAPAVGLAKEEDSESPRKKRKTEPQKPEATPAAAAGVAAAASTRGPRLRRQAPRSRIVVEVKEGEEKCFRVGAASDSAMEIDRVIHARERAIEDEAVEKYGARDLDDARELLFHFERAVLARGNHDMAQYTVIDARLQKRSKYYAFKDWAATPQGRKHLRKYDSRTGRWTEISIKSPEGPWVIPRQARKRFKTHCDHTFGGERWFDVICQMGGCPREFIDAVNAVIDQRRAVAI